MTTTTQSLEPCPFCGNREPFMRYEWQVCCGEHGTSETTCACEGPFANTEAEAIEAWNARAALSVVDTEMEITEAMMGAGRAAVEWDYKRGYIDDEDLVAIFTAMNRAALTNKGSAGDD